MKNFSIFRVLFALLFVFLCVHLVGLHLASRGDDHALNLIQKIRFGMTKSEVLEVIGTQPSTSPASPAPAWIDEVTGGIEVGEYWYYLLGFPSRNLIVYFDEDETVGFVTWAST